VSGFLLFVGGLTPIFLEWSCNKRNFVDCCGIRQAETQNSTDQSREIVRMPKPEVALVKKWRDLAEKGYLYAEIARLYPGFSVDQVRHYCLGHTGRKIPGPLQKVDRWLGSNVWLRGESSPHAELSEESARQVLDDWDEEADRWKMSGADWAKELNVSASTIYMLRRGETWRHLGHPNSGRKSRRSRRRRRRSA